MTHHVLEPEATGTVGDGAVWTQDASGSRTQADPLRCEFAGWLGDELVGVHPDFIVAGSLADALRASDLTGFELREAVVTTSPEFVSYAGGLPQRWERLDPTGRADGNDDFAQRDGMLLVSERALALLNEHRIVEASVTGAEDTDQTARFIRQRDAARTKVQERARAEREAEADAGAQEAARVTELLASRRGTLTEPPTMRANADPKRRISGDVTLAAAALGGTIDDDSTLAVLNLIDGSLVVNGFGTKYCSYESADRSLQVHLDRGVVKYIEYVIKPHYNAPKANYRRTGHIIDGLEMFTREAVLERLGEPKAVRTGKRTAKTADEYRLGRKLVFFLWDGEEHRAATVRVGRK
ncbi:hypothetical protein [Pseudoclavibacter terrae]|uniref:Uncharacterized protein n=1 Tax=Pseudoclavibacter terrae TaxID=1530195 RepID=A0A7J5B0N0_9MICO|nr:hypothetical protein [Pseudoclavibacter terrae]KAB1637473.1 hypothetical protein F8O03_09570 [Pseudoclavibacter terrae]